MLEGLRTVVFPVEDLDDARAFYEGLLGYPPYYDAPYYVGFDVCGYELGLSPDNGASSTDGPHPYWGVRDVDAAIARAVELGARPVSAPQDVGGGITLAVVRDPSGNTLGFIHNPGFRSEVGAASAAGTEPLAPPIVRADRLAASPAEVWRLWTTSQGMSSWLAPANIELRIGGPFELAFDSSQPAGRQGSEGCRVLAFLPEQMLSFTWNAPPHLHTRGERTWVVVELQPDGNGTLFTLTHTGWPAEKMPTGDWARTYAYFERAWTGVLEALALHCIEATP